MSFMLYVKFHTKKYVLLDRHKKLNRVDSIFAFEQFCTFFKENIFNFAQFVSTDSSW